MFLKTMVSLKVCIFGRSRVGMWCVDFEVAVVEDNGICNFGAGREWVIV